MTRPAISLRILSRSLQFCSAALALLACVALGAAPAAAGNETVDLASFYRADLRALAMGNAFGPLARGENALLYNPAGLVQYDLDIKLDGTLVIEGEQGDFLNDTRNNLIGSPSASDVQSYLSKYLGTTQYYRGQTFVNGVANLAAFNVGVGAGVLNQTRYGLTFADTGPTPGSPDIDLADPTNTATNDSLVLDEQKLKLNVVAFGAQLGGGQLLLGVALKNFTYERKTATDTFGSMVTSANVDLATSGGSYTASTYDVGMIWRLETFPLLRAQWSLTAANVGGVTLQQTGQTSYDVPATYNAGLALNPELPLGFMHLLIAVELEDVTGAIKIRDSSGLDHDRSQSQRLHAGAELGFWETTTGNHVLNVRVGSYRGQPTTGLEINLWSGLRLVYTAYTEDFGSGDAADRHELHAYQLTLGIGI